MSKLLECFVCGGVVAVELSIIIIGFFAIQFVMYRVFNINLFKAAINFSRKLDKYLSKKLYV